MFRVHLESVLVCVEPPNALLDYTSRARWPEGLLVRGSKIWIIHESTRYRKTSRSDPKLVALDGVTIVKTRFFVAKTGPFLERARTGGRTDGRTYMDF